MKRFSSRLTRGSTKGGLSLTAPKMSSTSSLYTAIGSAFWFEHLNLNLIVVVVVAAGGFILDPLQRERAAATTVFSHLFMRLPTVLADTCFHRRSPGTPALPPITQFASRTTSFARSL
jgi:hypothetical protein